MRPVREHLSGGRDHARAAPEPGCASQGAGRIERGGAFQLRALRQAFRHAPDDRQHARQAGRPLDVRRRHAAPADVRRLPRRRHDGEQERGEHLRRAEMSGQPMQFVPTLSPEDQARANFYALLSRLFYAPADAGLLSALGSAQELDAQDKALAKCWRELCESVAGADVETLRDEYETTFIGTGKAPITLHMSAYSIRYSNETPLARLRGQLAELGLARRSNAGEPEDHIAALCDVMRHLIAEQQHDLSTQKQFFERWIQP